MKKKSLWFGGSLLILLTLALSGRALWYGREIQTFTYTPSDEAPALTSSRSLVGAAVVDITPPPGRSHAGFSVAGHQQMGFRTRLKARAFYFKPEDGPALMLIQADLLAGSRLLHHRLAEELAKKTDIAAGAILIAGTHGHGGPGNFFASNFYNDWAGNSDGLDVALTDFLSERLIEAATKAFQDRREGTVTVGHRSIYGLTRNRSLLAYQQNPGHKEEGAGEAINPLLTMLRFDAVIGGRLTPIGAFSSFSIHGTTVAAENLYHADLFHYPGAILSQQLKARPDDPDVIVGVVNSTHGDNSPNWHRQGFAEARRIGTALAGEMAELWGSLTPELKPHTTRVAVSEVSLKDPLLCPPKVGMAVLGGAEDYRTVLLGLIPGFAEGWPKAPDGCQGAKRILGSFLQQEMIPEDEFPLVAMVQALRIDDLTLLSLPFEVTKEAGLRLARTVSGDHTAIISCANDYLGYLTTKEEYNRQDYEGAHSLFGPGTEAFLSEKSHALSRDLEARPYTAAWQPWRFELRVHPRTAIGLARKDSAVAPLEPASGVEATLTARWQQLQPEFMAFHTPLLRLEGRISPQGVWRSLADDEGDLLSVRLIGTAGDKATYEAAYYGPQLDPGSEARFIILAPKPLTVAAKASGAVTTD